MKNAACTRRSTCNFIIPGYWKNDICRHPETNFAPSEADIWADAKIREYFALPATADFTAIPGYTGFRVNVRTYKGQDIFQYCITTADTVYHFWFPGDETLAKIAA